jgi:hypothetical protein
MRRLGFRRLATLPVRARKEDRPTRSRLPFFTALGLVVVVVLVSSDPEQPRAQRADADVILYGRDGRRFSSGELSIPGRTFIEVDLRDLVAAAGEGFEDGSLQVSYVGRVLALGGLLTMTNPENGTEWLPTFVEAGWMREQTQRVYERILQDTGIAGLLSRLEQTCRAASSPTRSSTSSRA